MARYGKITAEPGKYAKPFIPTHPGGVHKMGCCDCGLVHDMQFTAWLKKRVAGKIIGYEKLSRRDVVVMVKARRNERATAAKRRKKQLCVKPK